MAISISLTLLLLVLAWIYVRNGGLKISHAFVCAMLGFALSGTSMGPTIQQGVATTADVVGKLTP
ncbi:hypothetical protein GCM10020367_66650 [Streptomyces sannanensis]|uniref:Uncharacterized protein n=1 Tax=Streptomyces sannanensis TaxID=285536 RepID=A0ABP6S3T6_9ACTN